MKCLNVIPSYVRYGMCKINGVICIPLWREILILISYVFCTMKFVLIFKSMKKQEIRKRASNNVSVHWYTKDKVFKLFLCMPSLSIYIE